MVKQNLFFRFLWVLSPLIFMTSPAEAESIPGCRNIGRPRPGQVCYTEHPFSARQRDEGGTRKHNFIVERVAQNWVIVDYEVIREGGFGAVSEPQGSIVSDNGNASIISATRRSIETLTEIRSQLQGKAAGCSPPVCGEIKGKINAVNREIERQSQFEQMAVTAGGNEKIAFSYTTSVSCNAFYCKSGASIHGKVRVYQRYLGNPNSLIEESQSVAREAQTRPLNW